MNWTGDDALSYEWTERAHDLIIAGRISATVRRHAGVRVSEVDGPCPRCDHAFAAEQVLDAVDEERTGVLGETAAPATQYVELDMWCECRRSHPGRPDDAPEGCGAGYRVPARLTA